LPVSSKKESIKKEKSIILIIVGPLPQKSSAQEVKEPVISISGKVTKSPKRKTLKTSPLGSGAERSQNKQIKNQKAIAKKLKNI
jgi:hypothetical protein